MIAGAGRSAAASAISDSGATTVRCPGRVPWEITAAGVSPAMPCSIRRAAFARSARTPIRNTSVPGVEASEAQSRSLSGLVGSSWPVTTVNWAATPRWVTGMPA